MISVVLATYNSTRYLLKQFDSIRNQTVQVDEVVIVDDCSSDDTIGVVNKYISDNKLNNWTMYKHDKNKGYIDTFRDGLEFCKGDIIITCDHDDIWLLNKVEVIKNAFDAHSEIMYLATSFIQIDENDDEVFIKQRKHRANNNLIRRKVNKGCLNKMSLADVAIYNIAPGCMCALKDSIKKKFLSLNDIAALPHDWSMSIIAALNNGLYYLDVPTTKYRIYSNNTIGLGHVNQYDRRLKIALKNYNEKQDEYRLTTKTTYDKGKIDYMENICEVFKKRYEYFEKKQISNLLKMSFNNFEKGTLYETLIFDILVIVKDRMKRL